MKRLFTALPLALVIATSPALADMMMSYDGDNDMMLDATEFGAGFM